MGALLRDTRRDGPLAQSPGDLDRLRIAAHVPRDVGPFHDQTQLLGEGYWSYGVEPNRHVLQTFLEYAREQGLTTADETVESLFAPETLEEYAI